MKEALCARIEAFFREFPFVGRYAKIRTLDKRPMVQRIDLDLLDRKGCTDAWNWGYRRAAIGDVRFLLIGANGEELRRIKQQDVARSKFNLFDASTWFRQIIEGETVYDGIQMLGDPNRVQYVLEVKDMWGGSRRGDFDPDYGVEVILHKVPSGRSFSEWLAQIRQIAASELQNELTKVNQA